MKNRTPAGFRRGLLQGDNKSKYIFKDLFGSGRVAIRFNVFLSLLFVLHFPKRRHVVQVLIERIERKKILSNTTRHGTAAAGGRTDGIRQSSNSLGG